MRSSNIIKIVALSCMTTIVFSCSKTETERDLIMDGNGRSIATENQQDESVQTVAFFEVEKGDTISKGIFRDKPLFDENLQIMFSSEDITQLRAFGQSSGMGYIYDLRVDVSSSNNAPASKLFNGRTYYKITVDLKENGFIYTIQKIYTEV